MLNKFEIKESKVTEDGIVEIDAVEQYAYIKAKLEERFGSGIFTDEMIELAVESTYGFVELVVEYSEANANKNLQ